MTGTFTRQIARVNLAPPGPRLTVKDGCYCVAVPGSEPDRWRILSSHTTITEALRRLGRERGR